MTEKTLFNDAFISAVFEKMLLGVLIIIGIYLGLGSGIISVIITGIFLIIGFYGALVLCIVGKPEATFQVFLGIIGSAIMVLKILG